MLTPCPQCDDLTIDVLLYPGERRRHDYPGEPPSGETDNAACASCGHELTDIERYQAVKYAWHHAPTDADMYSGPDTVRESKE